MTEFLTKLSPKIIYIAVLVFILLIHLSYLPNGFVWLDHGDIEQGRAIMSLSDLPNIFFVRYGETGFYRPLVTLANSIDFTIYKLFAPGYHLTNSLLHVAVTAVVPLFLSVLFPFSFAEMIIAMLIVGTHPLAWLQVGATTYRTETLLTLFCLLTVYFHAKATSTMSVARTVKKDLFAFAAVLCFLFALFAKETAIVIVPALIFFWTILQHNMKAKHEQNKHNIPIWKQPDKLSRWSLYLSEFVVFCIYILFRQRAVPEFWKATSIPLSFSDTVGTRLVVLSRLALDFIIPFKPTLSDAVPLSSVFSIIPAVVLIVVLITLLGIFKMGIKSVWSRAILLFFILLIPVLSIVPIPRLGSPHYGYLPLVGFAALVILAFSDLQNTVNGRLRGQTAKKQKADIFRSHASAFSTPSLVFSLLLVGWLLCMSVTTFTNGFHFRNDYTLFEPEVEHDHNFLEGYFYLGNYFLEKQKLQAAEKNYFLALRSNPKVLAYSEKQSIFINLASVYLQRNQLDMADHALSQAESLTVQNNVQTLFHNRMILAYKRHNYKAVIELSQDDRAFPYSPITFIILADSLHNSGRDEEAAGALKQLLPLVSKKEQPKIQQEIQLFSRHK